MQNADDAERVRRIVLALLAACATPYQSKGYTGGFSETQLDVNVFRVNFNGNAYTSGERAVDFTLLRSAELAREHGYHYFIVVQHSAGYSYSTRTTPTQSHTTERRRPTGARRP